MTSESEKTNSLLNHSPDWTFPGQTAENRREDRIGTEGKVQVIRIDGGHREEVEVYLRDISSNGLSGTYFGEKPLAHGPGYFLCSQETEQELRLVWSQATIEGVFMLGFERIVAF